jgi:hypothetical protein
MIRTVCLRITYSGSTQVTLHLPRRCSVMQWLGPPRLYTVNLLPIPRPITQIPSHASRVLHYVNAR